jgi:hypothetical protein
VLLTSDATFLMWIRFRASGSTPYSKKILHLLYTCTRYQITWLPRITIVSKHYFTKSNNTKLKLADRHNVRLYCMFSEKFSFLPEKSIRLHFLCYFSTPLVCNFHNQSFNNLLYVLYMFYLKRQKGQLWQVINFYVGFFLT